MYNATSCNKQPSLLPSSFQGIGILPQTRYQGSKYKILKWIDNCTNNLDFNSVLDAFGGTGSVGYMFKKNGKKVFYNDILKFNSIIGKAIIENNSIFLESEDIEFILKKHQTIDYPSFIYDNFHDIYFTDDENKWLDIITTNIKNLHNEYKQALAYYALFQSCIIKRPYNLFHRKNLYIRMAEVERSFGNKKTWDRSFEYYFKKFSSEANLAIFDNGNENKSFHADIFDINYSADLIYIDTPYISRGGVGLNYADFYHFLEGLTFYDNWQHLIDNNSKHKKIKGKNNIWNDKNNIYNAFEKLFYKFQNSILAVSYREDGIPSIEEIVSMLSKYKNDVHINKINYKYTLSNKDSKEILIIAK